MIRKDIQQVKNSLRYSLAKIYYPDVISESETIESIIQNKSSISRFGDGELGILFGNKNVVAFQKESEELIVCLQEIAQTSLPQHQVAIPNIKGNISKYNEKAQSFWKNYCRRNAKNVAKFFGNQKLYDTSFTRPYIDYNSDEKELAKQRFDHIKKIWEAREVLIVEGEHTKLGVGNDLFTNSTSIKRIICPEVGAFEKHKVIIQQTLRYLNSNLQDPLVLIALGPTATVLAYELAKIGIQAVDIGHVDVEYEWFLRKAQDKIKIPGKYVNEAGGYLENIANIKDEENYQNSIVADLH